VSLLVGFCRPQGLVIGSEAQQNSQVANFDEKLEFVYSSSFSASWFVPTFCFPLLTFLADDAFSIELKTPHEKIFVRRSEPLFDCFFECFFNCLFNCAFERRCPSGGSACSAFGGRQNQS
jgi:hypothetical protein